MGLVLYIMVIVRDNTPVAAGDCILLMEENDSDAQRGNSGVNLCRGALNLVPRR